jgi:uncharacterized secreted protein with C-terminal beta-propeller domain
MEPLERRQLLAATVADGMWQITADANRRAPNDVISVAPAAQDPATLRATINGVEVGTTPIGAIQQIRIDAGRGNDRVTIDLGTSGNSISVTVLGGLGHDRITGAGETDTFRGGPGNDKIDAGGGNDTLFGDAGADQLLGGDDDDTLTGGGGNDILAGSYGDDILIGEKGGDRLRGGGDDDSLDGGTGNDRLIGGEGADTFAGGKGADRVDMQEGVDTLAAVPGSSPNQPADPRDTVEPDDVTTPAVRQQDDAQLKQWLINAAVKQWSWAFEQPAYPWGFFYALDGEVHVGRDMVGALPPGPSPVPSLPPGNGLSGAPPTVGTDGRVDSGAESAGDPDHSDTNNQEEGVDEADLVETDGQFIYTLRENSLVIVDATPADQMSVISRTEVAETPVGIYLHGNRLTVVSESYNWHIGPVPIAVDRVAAPGMIAPPSEPPKAEVFVTVFDVTDRASPSQIEKTTLDGTYSGSRLVNDRLYLVISNNTWVPAPAIIPAATEESPDDGTADPGVSAMLAPFDPTWRPGGEPGGVYESEASYRARLEAMSLDELLPGYTATSISGDTTGRLVTSADAYVRDLESSEIGQNLTTVALLNLGDTVGGPTATSTVAGFGGEIYASPTSLYLASASYSDSAGATTRLLKFQLAPDAVPLSAVGEVQGSVPDQFAMDEEGDYFRVATSNWASGESTANVFVLEQSGDELNITGSLTGLKPGESLRSTRFVGDTAYLVTFRQIDPLLAIDLSNPSAPTLAGELHIPGFSSYLQPIGEGLLLGLGRDIDPDTNQDRGLQLSLFDVSNPANPKRIDALRLSDNWETSEAEIEHHAFAYFSDQKILALPVSHTTDDGVSSSSLTVLRIDPEAGTNAIEKLGAPLLAGVRRSLRIGDTLYGIGSDEVKAVQVGEPNVTIGSVDLKEE